MSIHVREISKSFGSFKALDEVSLDVPEGTLLALLGPLAGVLYRRRAARPEILEVRLVSAPNSPASNLRLRAHRDELIALELELGPRLQLSSDGRLLSSPI